MPKKIERTKEKSRLHPRNRHLQRYDFKELTSNCPELSSFVKLNPYQDESIDFSDPEAVKMLNRALLLSYYDINYWDIPDGYLCPPIPGRADYIHHIADLLRISNFGRIPTGIDVRCLDIGVGASCIYPIIGNKEYGWSFVGSDIDPVSIESSKKLVSQNASLRGEVEIRHQTEPKKILKGVVQNDEHFDVVICNPPFHASAEAALTGSLRKVNNLNHKKISKPVLNFGGQNNELWCEGGEKGFIKSMIQESMRYPKASKWYSSLVSKQSNLKAILGSLKEAKVSEVKTIPMGQGNKTSRIVAWTFNTKG
ncbi:MAG: 23S rRNA (adenine(1618)-N(6))-methyltransferase RlmF [Cyclobacteriaceae bacterium]